MPAISTFRPGQPRWIELGSTDPQRAQDFYGPLLGWTFSGSDAAFGGHVDCAANGSPVAGISPGDTNEWLVFLSVDDATATRDAAEHNGAHAVVLDDVGERGRMLILVDPTGATIGGWQARTFSGFETMYEQNSAVWFELVTDDFDTASQFYRTVFGWSLDVLSDTDDFRFSTFGTGDDAVAGIEDGSHYLENESSHWVVYFLTTDTDSTVERAIELGATLRSAAEDTPYGRLAELSDPAGARFRVLQEP